MMISVNYVKTSVDAINPFKKYPEDAGFDLYATWIEENEKYVEYGTNIIFEIPVGYVGLLFPRSSVTETDLMLKNSVGVIDASYRGEIKFRFMKTKNNTIRIPDGRGMIHKIYNPRDEVYQIGERVGQIVFLQLPNINLSLVSELTETERGAGGYGHTGKK